MSELTCSHDVSWVHLLFCTCNTCKSYAIPIIDGDNGPIQQRAGTVPRGFSMSALLRQQLSTFSVSLTPEAIELDTEKGKRYIKGQLTVINELFQLLQDQIKTSNTTTGKKVGVKFCSDRKDFSSFRVARPK